MEGRSFGDVPLNLELKLEVVDSPNSAGIVIDAVRCAKLGARSRPLRRARVAERLLHEVAAGAAPRRCVPRRSGEVHLKVRPAGAEEGAGAHRGRGVAPAVNPLKLCLASPYALAGAHPVAEHVRGVATALAERGHRVTVLAPNSSTRALRSGRRRLRALAAGDHEALIALDGEPLQVAVAPATPLRQRGRRRGVGLPVAARANVALAVGQGGFDIVHAFEPLLPGVATSALRHSPGLTVATFHAPDRVLHYPVRGGTLERYRARIDALLATSAEAAEQAAAIYPGDYTVIPEGIGAAFVPGQKHGTRVAVEWHGEGRAVVRSLVKLAASTPRASSSCSSGAAAAGGRCGRSCRPRRVAASTRRAPRTPTAGLRCSRRPTSSSPPRATTRRWRGRRARAAARSSPRSPPAALDLDAPGTRLCDRPAGARGRGGRPPARRPRPAREARRGGSRGRRRAGVRSRRRAGRAGVCDGSTRAGACTGARRSPAGR